MKYRKLTEIKKLEGNPRTIEDDDFKTLCDSIRDNPKYFEARPLILSDRTGELVIIAGNQRYDAAVSLKLTKVPTFLMEGLTEEKEREIIIRDNVNNGKWNYELLKTEWADVPLIEWGVDMQILSGDAPENAGLMRRNFESGKGKDIAEKMDLFPEKYPVTFILDESEYAIWQETKQRMKTNNDKTAFLKLIGGKDA